MKMEDSELYEKRNTAQTDKERKLAEFEYKAALRNTMLEGNRELEALLNKLACSNLTEFRQASPIMSVLRIAAALLFSATISFASPLKWEAPTIEIKAKPGDRDAIADFKFSNASDNFVELGRIQTSCGCTAATPSQIKYNPGESGSIKVVFTFEGR